MANAPWFATQQLIQERVRTVVLILIDAYYHVTRGSGGFTVHHTKGGVS